jgi:hypothetical protein
MIMKTIRASQLSLSIVALLTLTSCIGMMQREPRVSKPLATDVNEVHWRMYYEDQFDAFSQAVPPGAGDPDVAWTAYYAEKNAYAIRENNQLLKEQLRLQRKKSENDQHAR